MMSFLLMTALWLTAAGQSMNRLYLPDISVESGKAARIPVAVENSDEIVALQFDLTLPAGITAPGTVTFSERGDGHTAAVRKIDNQGLYRLVVFSNENKPFKGNSGNLLYIDVQIPDGLIEGQNYPVEIKEVVLAGKKGDNLISDSKGGIITILVSPDIVPMNLRADKVETSPGETLTLEWDVHNKGGRSTAGGWKEQLYLVTPTSSISVPVGSDYYDQILSVGQSIHRNLKVTIPDVLGLDGDCYFLIKLVPDAKCGEPASFGGNNSLRSENKCFVNKQLYLSYIDRAVSEASIEPIRCTLTRSGSVESDEIFNINVSHKDKRISLPETIKIPSGQKAVNFYISLKANGTVDEENIFDFEISGNNYPSVTGQLDIIDDTYPSLDLSFPQYEINEGESMEIEISIPKIRKTPLVVYLTTDRSKRFNYPDSVVIPVGKNIVKATIEAIDNSEVELDEDATFSIKAEGYENDEADITVKDNDMPELELVFSPEQVSESDGPNAVIATIRRLTNVDKDLSLTIMDDSDGFLYYSGTRLSMSKGTKQSRFMIGIRDNDKVDGDHIFNVKVAVYSSSCDCYASELSGGFVSKQLTVLDDDSPRLSLSSGSSAFLEGSTDNTIVVSRNTNPDTELNVVLSSDSDDLLEYNHSLVIPVGEASAELKVAVKSNQIENDGKIISFKAVSEGLGDGTCWVIVTDQTLPDATVAIQLKESKFYAGDSIDIPIKIANIGNTVLPRNTPLEIRCPEVKNRKVFTKASIEPGDSAVLVVEGYKLPSTVRTVQLEAEINPDETVKELTYANNSSVLRDVQLQAPYSVTAKVEKPRYDQGVEVVISGQVSGLSLANVPIEVYIYNSGSRQTIKTHSDSEGKYKTVYKLLPKQSGRFEVGACYPTADIDEVMDIFDVYGLQTSGFFNTCEIKKDDTYKGKIKISNPGVNAQNGIFVKPLSESDNCIFSFNYPKSIKADGTIEIEYSIKANEVSSGRDFQRMPLEITTEEGSKLNYTIYYYVQSRHGKLYSVTSEINTTMTKDTPREYPIVIRNIGDGETGLITFALPDWIETATPREMASLASGDSATVVLRLKTTSEMKLNLPVKGSLGINCKNGDGISIPLTVVPVSENKGTLKFDITDEFTYYTEEAPHVSNAVIKIINPSNREVVVEGVSDSHGLFEATLDEGWYMLTVDADNHDPYSNNIIVDPGVEKFEEVFLPYQVISYTWNVEETEIEDEYVMETVCNFDTRVPKPVIEIALPDEKPEPYDIIPVKLTNRGLINAVNIEVSLEASPGFEIEFLNDPTTEVLAPQQTAIFYARLVPVSSSDPEASPAKASSTKCLYLISKAKYHELCEKYTGAMFVKMLKKYGKKQCFSGGIGGGHLYPTGGGYGGYGGGVGHPSCWRGSAYGSDYYLIDLDDPEKYCDRKKKDENPEDEVPEGEPEEQDCDEEPVLIYKLIPVNGSRQSMQGVSADGVSQVRLVLDPRESKLPKKDCSNFYDFEWRLSQDIGTIESTSMWEAVYTAPEDYPENYGSSTSIEATLWYTQQTSENTTWGRHSKPVTIKIIRAPLILIHGLNDKGYNPKKPDSYDGCWTLLYRSLTKYTNLYEDFNIKRMDYSPTNSSSFDTNASLIKYEIKNMQRQTKQHGFISTKCDLVGHSMGGILSRIHVQRFGDEFVNKLITVNTPHSGSEVGDAVRAHKIAIGNLARLYMWDLDVDAIGDLAVESSAISDLNSPSYLSKDYDVAVHSVVTQTNCVLPSLLAYGGEAAGDIADKMVSKFPWGTLFAILMKYSQHFIDDLSQVGEGDMVVSTESQLGGCEANTVIKNGPWHSSSPKDYKVIEAVRNLLLGKKESSAFSKGWFHPAKRSFVHDPMWALQVGADWAQDILLSKFEDDIKENLKLDYIQNSNKDYLEAEEDWKEIEEYYENVKNKMDIIKTVKDFVDDNIPSMRLVAPENQGYSCYVMSMTLPHSDILTNPSVIFTFEDGNVEFKDGNEVECIVPSTFKGKVDIAVLSKYRGKNVIYDTFPVYIEETVAKQDSISVEDCYIEVGELSDCNVICYWDDESETYVKPETVTFDKEGIAKFENGKIVGLKKGSTMATVSYQGLSCNLMVYVFAPESEDSGDDSEAICSTVTLSFKQRAVMTRQAFRGTLTLNNGSETSSVRDFKLNLEVRDTEGNIASKREFQITPEKVEGFQGSLNFNSGWTLDPSQQGVATILFIPTKYAAPTEPKDYEFGGSFSYADPYTGLTVTRDLKPIRLTVNPSPELELTYFMQRDVFGDDPLTDTVEPMIPSEFALLVNNKGYGDATSLKLSTDQPQITSNEKGLYINFELLSSQLNGGEKSLMLGQSGLTDFGNLKAGEQSYAQWWLQSSLLGHFVKYNVKATHVTSYDNPDLALVDTATIHELIHGFDILKQDGSKKRAFLVNDLPDVEDFPDAIYFSDATHAYVTATSGAYAYMQSELEYMLHVDVDNPGWSYGNIVDPTNGRKILTGIKRMSDGAELSPDNFWQTDRTLRDGKDPLAENRLHFVDNFEQGACEYLLTFVAKPNVELVVDTVVGIPYGENFIKEQLSEVHVTFNKPIVSGSFTPNDISLTCQGKRVDVKDVAIERITDAEYSVKFGKATEFDGFYSLTIRTDSIKDIEGYYGKYGKNVSWVQYLEGKTDIVITADPIDGGCVTPESGRFDYDSSITLKAIPNEGFDFIEWKRNGKSISNSDTVRILVNDKCEYIARFTPKNYGVTVDFDAEGGVVDGAATGIYAYGDTLVMTAVPAGDWRFDGWIVDGVFGNYDSTLSVIVKGDTRVEAVFVDRRLRTSFDFESGWTWMSHQFDSDVDAATLMRRGGINRIVGQLSEMISDPVAGLVGNLSSLAPATLYKVEAAESTTTPVVYGLVANPGTPISLVKGWNWIGFTETEPMSLDDMESSEKDDYIVGQEGFAQHDGQTWVGTLTALTPGAGYLYRSESAKYIVYPHLMPTGASAVRANMPVSHLVDVRRYPQIMGMIAVLVNDLDEVVAPNTCEVRAYCGDVCRGVGQVVQGRLMISVYGNAGDRVRIAGGDGGSSDQFVTLAEVVLSETLHGSLDEPVRLKIGDLTSTGLVDGLGERSAEVRDRVLYINGVAADGVDLIELYDNVGRRVMTRNDLPTSGISVAGLPAGVYVVTVDADGCLTRHKVIIK